MAQPSKLLFPKPPVSDGLLLNHLGTLMTEREARERENDFTVTSKSSMNQLSHLSLILAPKLKLFKSFFFLDVRNQMNLPLNGFHQDREMKPGSYSVGQGDGSQQTPAEEWPDWSGRGGTESSGGQPVQIHIQASAGGDPLGRRLELAEADLEEEPWDDFEEPEPTSDLSPTTPLSDRDIPPPAGEGATVPVRKAPATLKPGSSRPLKLTSAPRESTQSKTPSAWGDGWAQEESSALDVKAGAPQKKTGSAGLGEEFTIKVKKKGQMDPELDLFADMVPDIKLSSSTLYSPSLQVDSALNKFAAANLTEASGKHACGDHLRAFHVVCPVFSSLSDIFARFYLF